jgi:hypothetical protein
MVKDYNKIKKEELELTLMKYNVHALSPYNDGWTQEFYKKECEKILKKLKKK